MFDYDPLKETRKRISKIARRHGDDAIKDAARRLEAPSDRLEARLDGPNGALDAFRVRFAQGGEPTKGGVRFSEDADMDEAERLCDRIA